MPDWSTYKNRTYEQIADDPTIPLPNKKWLIQLYHGERVDEWNRTHPGPAAQIPTWAARKPTPAEEAADAAEAATAKVATIALEKMEISAPEGWEDYWDESGYLWKWDKAAGERYKAKFDASRIVESPYERAMRARAEAETRQVGIPQPPWMYQPYGTSPYDIPETLGIEGQWNPYTGRWEQPPGWISPAEQERIRSEQGRMQLEREVFGWQQQVRQQEIVAEKDRQLAQLRANPASWLEYASLAGQTPSIQPWMLPLMPQQYAGKQAGQPIPGYQASGQNMNLPELIAPSAQYMSRIPMSARQQYYGFEQARTGATPEDVQWRLWSQAPPSGAFTGLRYTRYG